MAQAGGARILVLEDDTTIRNLVARHLVAQGHTCQACSDARAGLELLGSSRIDALLASAEMPGLDGIRLLQEVAALDPGLPVILTTGKGSFEVAVRALQLGHDHALHGVQHRAALGLDRLDFAGERLCGGTQRRMDSSERREVDAGGLQTQPCASGIV